MMNGEYEEIRFEESILKEVCKKFPRILMNIN